MSTQDSEKVLCNTVSDQADDTNINLELAFIKKYELQTGKVEFSSTEISLAMYQQDIALFRRLHTEQEELAAKSITARQERRRQILEARATKQAGGNFK